MKFADVPTIFLSYREPNADENYERLRQQNPKAQRVHGVKGFDAAHKAASTKAYHYSKGPWFITVDGDNEVFPEFWNLQTADIPTNLRASVGGGVISWNSYNPMTGLSYGNGGLKLWSHEFVADMKTHEQSEGRSTVDFCWDEDYVQMARIYSYTRPYGSPLQAFTAGFREGVKMPLVNGKPTDSVYETVGVSHNLNIKRLLTWCSVGAHVDNGEWSVKGALLGFHLAHINKSIDLSLVSDFDFISDTFNVHRYDGVERFRNIRNDIEAKTGLVIPSFGPGQSKTVVSLTVPHNSYEPFERERWPQALKVKF